MKHFIMISIFLLLIQCTANSQQQVKIMTYNLLNYSGADTSVRNPYFRTVINAINPDVLVVCEITSQTAVNNFLNKIMNSQTVSYGAGTFINGYDTDNAIFYKTAKFNFIGNTPVITELRDINEFRIADKFYEDTLRIYAVHLRAGDTSIVRRGWEIDSLRKKTNQLPSGSNFVVLGDFNIYGSGEPAYQKLIQNNANDDGNAIDPLNLTGVWNNFFYSAYHTQSTRTRSFGDGANGGMDDRFDMILYSNAVKNLGGIKFMPGTYTAFGNDGNHYNDSINKIPNTSVTQTIANALHYASDHLPVYAEFEFGSATVFNLKVIPQGYYNFLSNKLNSKDTITFYLRNVYSPFSKVDSSKAIVDSATFNAAAIFRIAKKGMYYIHIKHRNSIETWSRSGGIQYSPDSVMSYDFTVSESMAFGNNLVLKGSKYCIYSGDINQNGVIDAQDQTLTDNDSFRFATGYLLTDVNGDRITDSSDLAIVENNSVNFIIKITPP